MNDVIFEFLVMDCLKVLAVFCVVLCLRVQYLKILRRYAVWKLRKGYKIA